MWLCQWIRWIHSTINILLIHFRQLFTHSLLFLLHLISVPLSYLIYLLSIKCQITHLLNYLLTTLNKMINPLPSSLSLSLSLLSSLRFKKVSIELDNRTMSLTISFLHVSIQEHNINRQYNYTCHNNKWTIKESLFYSTISLLIKINETTSTK
jgi:hypothetical protein